jgi:hypothetical protein
MWTPKGWKKHTDKRTRKQFIRLKNDLKKAQRRLGDEAKNMG